jgi:hypothetical protein
MRKGIFYIILIMMIAVIFFSCTKVVNLNLNSSSPRLIIESSISDQPSSCFVKLTMSVNYNEPNTFPPVNGASVVLYDDTGKTYTMYEASSGVYTLQSIKGIPGKTYTLSITTAGKTYTATSKMPDPVSIDTIYQSRIFLGPYRGNSELKFVTVNYHDPPGKGNYYRFVEQINRVVKTEIFLDDDLLKDGNLITQNIIRADTSLKTGDSVSVFLQTIDKNVFNYFLQLSNVTGGYNGPTATPANPISNFNGGALGYFSAYAVRSKSIIIR